MLVNTAAVVTGNGWAMVVALASVPFLLDGLGARVFGLWVLVQTFSALNGWLSVAALGLGKSSARAIASAASLGDRAGTGEAAAGALVLHAACALIAGGMLAGLGPWLLPGLFNPPASAADDLRFALVVFAGQAAVELVWTGCAACLEGIQRIDLGRMLDAVRRTAVAVATITVAQGGGGLRGVAVAGLLATLAATALTGVMVATRLPAGRPTRASMKELVGYGATIGVLDATGVLHRTMDRVIAGAVLGPASVALVEIATQVQNGAAAVLSATSYAGTSATAWLRARGDANAERELLERGTKYSVLASAPFMAGAAVLAGPLVAVWVGDRYHEAAGLIPVALVALALSAPVSVASNLLQGGGRAAAVLKPALAAVAVNLAVSLALVHVVGLVGVFIGTVASALMLLPFLSRAALHETALPLPRFVAAVGSSVLPTLALAAVAGAAVFAPLGDGLTLVVGVPGGAAAYLLVARRFAIRPEEMAELRALVRRGEGA